MENKHLRFIAFAFVVGLFISFSGSHPVGRSGAPGDGLCTDCHSGGAGVSGNINILGLPSQVEGGVTYTLTAELEATAGSPSRGGFQVVALFDSNDNQAGTWSNPDGSSSLKSGGGRVYFGHEPFRNFGAGSVVEWEADWEAPMTADDVTFYMAGNLANGNGSNSGDRIVVNQMTTTVTVVQALELSFSNIGGVSCFGGSDGTATVTVMGGTPPYTIEWSNGETGATANALPGGSVTVSVEDNNGMMASDVVDIPEPDEIDFDITVLSPSCAFESDGSILLEPFGGTGSLECFWEDFGPGCQQDNVEAGVYVFTITDANGCQIESDVFVDEPDPLSLQFDITDASGNASNGSIVCTPQGGTAPYDFEWSTGAFDSGDQSSISGLSPGEYTVLVIDDNGCEIEEQVEVGGTVCTLSGSVSVTDVLCAGDMTGSIDLTVSNASNPVSYLWSNGATTQDLVGVAAGVYAVSIEDADNCVDTIRNIVVGENDSIQISNLTKMDVLCTDDMNGVVQFDITGGVSPYEVFWSNGITNDTMVNGLDTMVVVADSVAMLAPGKYSFTVTDALGCNRVDSTEILILDNTGPIINANIYELTLDAAGQAGPVDLNDVEIELLDQCDIAFVDLEQRNFSCSDLGLNQLQISATDINGNSSTGMLSVLVLDDIAPVIECNNVDIVSNSCNPIEYNDVTASDNCGVDLLILQSGLPSGGNFPVGTTVVSYLAQDASGNTAECSFSVTVDINLAADFNVMNADCSDSNGSVEVDITGGTPPYTVSPANLSNLSSGVYTILIEDSAGCALMEDVVIDQEDFELDYTITTSGINCNGEETGEIIAMVNDNPGDVSISIDGVDTEVLSGLPAGIYVVVFTQVSTGCTESFDIEITENEPIDVQVVELLTDACSGAFIDLVVDVSGGQEPYRTDVSDNGDNVVVTVTDDLGCVVSQTIDVELIENPLTLGLVEIINATGSESNGSVDVDVTGGVAPYTYVWLDALLNVVSTEEDLTGVLPGDYTIEVTDANGCIAADQYTVDMNTSTAELDKIFFEPVLSPNPANDFIQLGFKAELPDQIEIYTTDGRLLLRKNQLLSENRIDLQSFTPGLYIIKMVKGKRLATEYFVKQ